MPPLDLFQGFCSPGPEVEKPREELDIGDMFVMCIACISYILYPLSTTTECPPFLRLLQGVRKVFVVSLWQENKQTRRNYGKECVGDHGKWVIELFRIDDIWTQQSPRTSHYIYNSNSLAPDNRGYDLRGPLLADIEANCDKESSKNGCYRSIPFSRKESGQETAQRTEYHYWHGHGLPANTIHQEHRHDSGRQLGQGGERKSEECIRAHQKHSAHMDIVHQSNDHPKSNENHHDTAPPEALEEIHAAFGFFRLLVDILQSVTSS